MTNIPEGLTCSVTPEQAYWGMVPKIPDGWEFVGFAIPVAGDRWLSTYKGMVQVHSEQCASPRIIVRRAVVVTE